MGKGGRALTNTRQAKAYLWRVRDAERELKRLEEEYEQVKADILHIKAMEYDKDKVSRYRIGDLSDAIIVLEGYAARIGAQWGKIIALREDAKARINQLQDGRYRDVLTRRYLQGQSFEAIAVGMGFDYRWTRRLHNKALDRFQELTLESPIKNVI